MLDRQLTQEEHMFLERIIYQQILGVHHGAFSVGFQDAHDQARWHAYSCHQHDRPVKEWSLLPSHERKFNSTNP